MTVREIFKQKFNLPRDDFLEPIDLIDVGIGFCVYKEQKDLKREDFKSVFKIYIKDKDFKIEGDKKSITITASYGKKTEDGLISYSSGPDGFKRDINWPVDLISTEEFFYDIKTYDLSNKNRTISGEYLLNLINELHLKSTKPFKGIVFRIRLSIFNALSKILLYLISSIQYLMSGEKADFNTKYNNTISPVNERGKNIKIFGCEVEIWIAFMYAFLHLISYIFCFYFNYRPQFITTIYNNNFLTIMYVILTLTITNNILSNMPRIHFKKLLLAIQEMSFKIISKGIKI